MVSARSFYEQFDEWSRNLSRMQYAVFVGVVSGLSFFGVSAVFGDGMAVGAVAFGATMTILLYLFNKNPPS